MATESENSANQSVHITYDLALRPYHRIIAGLVERYGPPNSRVLDVGCGVGSTLQLIRQRNAAYALSGADIDENCLRITQDRVKLERAIKINDVLDLAEPSTTDFYDVIILSHVLEHVTRPCDAVRSLMSMLKPGGHLILAVPNPVRPDVVLYNLFRQFHKVNRGHVQTWDRATWWNFLENILGLNVVEYPVDFIRVPGLDNMRILHPLLQFLARLLPGFARSCMAVIKRE